MNQERMFSIENWIILIPALAGFIITAESHSWQSQMVKCLYHLPDYLMASQRSNGFIIIPSLRREGLGTKTIITITFLRSLRETQPVSMVIYKHDFLTHNEVISHRVLYVSFDFVIKLGDHFLILFMSRKLRIAV